jgi:hypothetical protein
LGLYQNAGKTTPRASQGWYQDWIDYSDLKPGIGQRRNNPLRHYLRFLRPDRRVWVIFEAIEYRRRDDRVYLVFVSHDLPPDKACFMPTQRWLNDRFRSYSRCSLYRFS